MLLSYKAIEIQQPLIEGVVFKHSSYEALDIPPKSIVYCDPPYEGTTQYKDKFDSAKFWQWCREKTLEGHKVFISEYKAPEDFICVWQGEICNSIGKGKAVEKLFIYNDLW